MKQKKELVCSPVYVSCQARGLETIELHCQLERSKHDSLRRVVRKGRVRTGIGSVDLLFTTLPPLVKNVIVILAL